jgi:hypothetical protein
MTCASTYVSPKFTIHLWHKLWTTVLLSSLNASETQVFHTHSSAQLFPRSTVLESFCLQHQQFRIPCRLPKTFYSKKFLYSSLLQQQFESSISNPSSEDAGVRTLHPTSPTCNGNVGQTFWCDNCMPHNCCKSVCERKLLSRGRRCLVLLNDTFMCTLRVYRIHTLNPRPQTQVTISGNVMVSYHMEV